MRTQLIAGNWKMNLTCAQALANAESLVKLIEQRPDVDVAVCVPFTAIGRVREALRNSSVHLGAQNVFWLEKGAYTGQISPGMLADFDVAYCIVGHSETRGRFGVSEVEAALLPYFAESDSAINAKIRALLFHSINPILCVGETADEWTAGTTEGVIRQQLEGALKGIEPAELYSFAVAYEPVWAIGTGQTCEADEAARICTLVRNYLADILDAEVADNIRVLYGGSVRSSNADVLLNRNEIDGLLVGGASLDAMEFARIVMAARHGG